MIKRNKNNHGYYNNNKSVAGPRCLKLFLRNCPSRMATQAAPGRMREEAPSLSRD